MSVPYGSHEILSHMAEDGYEDISYRGLKEQADYSFDIDDENTDNICSLADTDESYTSSLTYCLSVLACTRTGRMMVIFLLVFIAYIVVLSISTKVPTMEHHHLHHITKNFNLSEARSILNDLCDSYNKGVISGDICNRLCLQRDWNVIELHKGNKVVIVIRQGGQEMVLKSQHARIEEFEELDPRISEKELIDALLEIVNYNLRLGWPSHFKKHLIEILWPTYVRKSGAPFSKADRRSLWALMSQEEYITFRVLPLSRVTPKIVGTCGHFYQVEHLVAFHMKGYYINLKAKILVHIMGMLKLFDEFLNEPLNWCDVKFENLGLAAEYPKRFMVMDADMLYTESRMNFILTSRNCGNDTDCKFFDCEAKCLNSTGTCSKRTNNNLDVICAKLIQQLFGNFWSKSNRYLTACHDRSVSTEKRLDSLRLALTWNLPDV